MTEQIVTTRINSTTDACADNLLFSDKELCYAVLSENERLKTVIEIQKYVAKTIKKNNLAIKLGNILIQGVAAPKAFFQLPGKLFKEWKLNKNENFERELGKNYEKVIAAYEHSNFEAAHALIVKAKVAQASRANAYTTLARLVIPQNLEQAALAARNAYEADPRPFRLKWLAFRLFDAGYVNEADAILELLSKNQYSATEAAMAAKITTKALLNYQCSVRYTQGENNITNDCLHHIFVESYDCIKDEVELIYATSELGLEAFFIENQDCIPTHAKTVFSLNKNSVNKYTRRLWIPLAGYNNDDFLIAEIGGQRSLINACSRMPVGAIRAALSPRQVDKSDSPYVNCWLFVDRDIQADDNAEHLYRYVVKYHPEINAVFALRNTSHDWQRLSKEGFHLIAWGSDQYDEALKMCAKFISSQVNTWSLLTKDRKYINSQQQVFLQHGIIKDDMSEQFKHKKIDLFVTSTYAEFTSIVGDKTSYKFTEKNVRCLGLPRHDALVDLDVPRLQQILVMPTWRKYAIGPTIQGHVREINQDFTKSCYFKVWSSFFNNKRLLSIVEKYNFSIVFFPHALMQPYIEKFQLPKQIQIKLHNESNIQTLFKNSALMITDFSSVAFEMAYLKRPVIYYQFDEQEFFSGINPHMQKGYFDYQKHGFGPVVTEENSLLDALEIILKQNAIPEKMYIERMNSTFAYHDNNNCARVFAAICELDKPNLPGYVNVNILREYTYMAIEKKCLSVALRRAKLLHSLDNSDESFQLLNNAMALCTEQAV